MKVWRKPFDRTEVAVAQGQVYVDGERCKGCGYCVEFCPRDVLKMGNDLNSKGYRVAVVDDENSCVACGYCEVICPEFAIKVSIPDNSSSK